MIDSEYGSQQIAVFVIVTRFLLKQHRSYSSTPVMITTKTTGTYSSCNPILSEWRKLPPNTNVSTCVNTACIQPGNKAEDERSSKLTSSPNT